jgi:CAAX prenyl protease-like protein
LDTRWLYPAQVGLVALALAVFWRRYDELRPDGPVPPGHWALGVVAGAVVFLIWIQLDFGWTVIGELDPGFDPRDDGRVNVVLAAFRLMGAALVVPVMEELFWRSFVMRWIDRPAFLSVDARGVSARAVLLSSAVFAVEHHQWFAGLIAGLAYAWLYRVTGNLWIPVLAHAVTNGLLGIWVLFTGAWQFW